MRWWLFTLSRTGLPGRGRKLTASPVKAVALENDIPVEQPLNFKTEESVETLRGYNADIMVVVAYGIILPQVVLDAPRLGCINVHASVLPRWRGAAPIHRALLAGDDKSGRHHHADGCRARYGRYADYQ